ncbi:MAG: sulfatase, partial [Planctomycetaceae bacterium]
MFHQPPQQPDLHSARRTFLQQSGLGFGSVAFSSLLADDLAAQSPAVALPPAHFLPKAKRVIYLFMAGGPSQFETF